MPWNALRLIERFRNLDRIRELDTRLSRLLEINTAQVDQLRAVSEELLSERALSSAQADQLRAVGTELTDERLGNRERISQLRGVGEELARERARSHAQADQLRSVGEELWQERQFNVALRAKIDSGADVSMVAAGKPAMQVKSIVFNALPKSASTYCYEVLRRSCGLLESSITGGGFPYEAIMWERFFRFAGGGCIVHDHIDANPANLFFLRRLPVVLIVHVRDPRQTILSWAHHLKRSSARTMEPHTILALPLSWWDHSLPSQLDTLIDQHLPVFVRWIEAWVAASEGGQADVIFTQFEKMVADPDGFFSELAKRCGLKEDALTERPVLEEPMFQFRAGQVDEWRSVFSSQQIDRANAAVPDALLARFGWNR